MTSAKKGLAKACEAAGIRGLHRHHLRHTFGTRLAEAGCSEVMISELMGHIAPKTTRRHAHGTDRAKREAVEAVGLRPLTACHKSATNEKQPPRLAAVNS